MSASPLGVADMTARLFAADATINDLTATVARLAARIDVLEATTSDEGSGLVDQVGSLSNTVLDHDRVFREVFGIDVVDVRDREAPLEPWPRGGDDVPIMAGGAPSRQDLGLPRGTVPVRPAAPSIDEVLRAKPWGTFLRRWFEEFGTGILTAPDAIRALTADLPDGTLPFLDYGPNAGPRQFIRAANRVMTAVATVGDQDGYRLIEGPPGLRNVRRWMVEQTGSPPT